MTHIPTLHFAMMSNQSNGGFASALTLVEALRSKHKVKVWSLFGECHPTNIKQLEQKNIAFHAAKPVAEITAGDHVFFYMNEYPTLFGNFENEWRTQLTKAASVQIAFNRTVGNLSKFDWLAKSLKRIYFQDDTMQSNWQMLTRNNKLGSIPCEILAPPVAMDDFLELSTKPQLPLVIGRLAGDQAVPNYAVDLYASLCEALPEAEFWFMPGPKLLRHKFQNHPQFSFFSPNEISVLEFYNACDIYLLTYSDGVPIPGPRSLVEAMAANCAPIVVNRDGPKLRVAHDESGYCANSQADFFNYTVKLAKDSALRKKIAAAARIRATSFKVEHWVNQIAETVKTGSNKLDNTNA